LQPKVAVIIPCYNYGRFVEEAVQSVLNQDMKIELVVIDDGSTDLDTLEVLKKLRKKGVFIYRQPNGGISKARNTGVRLTSAENLVCLDADDIIQPAYCSSCYQVMLSRHEVGFVYSTTRVFGDENRLWSNISFSALHLLIDNYLPCAAMFRRRVWEENGGFAETMEHGYEDWDFWLSAVEKGWFGFHLPQALFWYRKHGQSMLSSSNVQRKRLKKILRCRHKSLYSFSYISKALKSESLFTPRVIKAALKEIFFRPAQLHLMDKGVNLPRPLFLKERRVDKSAEGPET